MSSLITQRKVVLCFLAAAIVLGGFAPVAPDALAGVLKAAAGVATGLAALFHNPPSLDGGGTPPAPPSVS
jgi:hypothetical protein